MLGKAKIKTVESEALQTWVGHIGKSPKTVANAYNLVQTSLIYFMPNRSYSVRLPQRQRPELVTPDDEDVKRLIEFLQSKDDIASKELLFAVYCAAFGPLRRGEVACLTSDDIDGDTIHVTKDVVQDEHGAWIIKPPKTPTSVRDVQMPEFVIQLAAELGPGRLIECTPIALGHRFEKAVKQTGVKRFRFHDLRHYAASILHAIGVPDAYIQARAGWASDRVMKNIYRHALDSEKAKQTERIIEHFGTVAGTDST